MNGCTTFINWRTGGRNSQESPRELHGQEVRRL